MYAYTLPSRVRLHPPLTHERPPPPSRLYYSNPYVKLLRSVAMLSLQLLVLFESPPWCLLPLTNHPPLETSNQSGQDPLQPHCQADALLEYHMSGVPLLGAAGARGIEGACLLLLLVDAALRLMLHGPQLFRQVTKPYFPELNPNLNPTFLN